MLPAARWRGDLIQPWCCTLLTQPCFTSWKLHFCYRHVLVAQPAACQVFKYCVFLHLFFWPCFPTPGAACGLSLRFGLAAEESSQSRKEQQTAGPADQGVCGPQVTMIATHTGLSASVRKTPECQPTLSLKPRIRVNMAPARSLVTRPFCRAELHTSCKAHSESLEFGHPRH